MTNIRIDPEVRAIDRIRGHRFCPPLADLKGVPKLYETEDVAAEDKIIYLHFFTGPSDWWIAELNTETWLAFGYANLGDPDMAEWGYMDLGEMALVRIGYRTIERDKYWTVKKFSEIKR